MRMPETITEDGTGQHICGFRLRYHVEITGVHLRQTNFPEFQLSYSDAKVHYQRYNDPEYLLSCPGCGDVLSKAVLPSHSSHRAPTPTLVISSSSSMIAPTSIAHRVVDSRCVICSPPSIPTSKCRLPRCGLPACAVVPPVSRHGKRYKRHSRASMRR